MDKKLPTAAASDEELAVRAAAGSRAAFEELVTRYTPRLFHFLRHRFEGNEDLEDLVQETFFRAYRSIGRYNARWKYATWLYTIAVRLAISRHRATKTGRVRPASGEPECPSPGPQEILARKEETLVQKNIWNLARTLGSREYEALWLRYAEEMPVRDIARTMGKTQVGIRALLHRSRLKLGKKLRSAEQAADLAGAAPAGEKYTVV
jgi:RNA polymerase sigma-70 factor (ECF subfamily)